MQHDARRAGPPAFPAQARCMSIAKAFHRPAAPVQRSDLRRADRAWGPRDSRSLCASHLRAARYVSTLRPLAIPAASSSQPSGIAPFRGRSRALLIDGDTAVTYRCWSRRRYRSPSYADPNILQIYSIVTLNLRVVFALLHRLPSPAAERPSMRSDRSRVSHAS
jgi:hypothetical protein